MVLAMSVAGLILTYPTRRRWSQWHNTLTPEASPPRPFNAEEIALLERCLTRHNPGLVDKLSLLGSGRLDRKEIHEMRSAVSNELIAAGLSNGEPTEYGWKLERLIERLGDFCDG